MQAKAEAPVPIAHTQGIDHSRKTMSACQQLTTQSKCWHVAKGEQKVKRIQKDRRKKSTELYLLVRIERCTCSPFSTGFTLSHFDLLISTTTVIRLCNVSWLQKITATKHSTLYNKSNKHHMVPIRDIKSQSLHSLNELYRMVLVMKGERFVYEFHTSAN